ncbi:hypothetical protein G6F68_011522 [Rhizopus microsporus]|nr:hypothetical protein G6F68_011522 [Rhizopus microsporus]
MNPKAAMVITAMKIIVEEKIWNTEAVDTVIDLHATQAVVAEDHLGRIDESALPVITEETITTAAVAEEVKRPRRLHNWDMAPAGMEGMTAQQVKMTGLFPLPGQVVGTRTPQSFQPPPQRMEDATPKQSKKLYVGQIPNTTDEVTLCDFFNATIRHELQDKTPVVGAQINHEKNFAFIEFHTSQQATACMVLDGISFQGNTLKIRRPNHYQPPEEQVPGLSTNVPDTPNKVFVGGLPVYLTDNQVMELLTSFGELRAFNLIWLVKD